MAAAAAICRARKPGCPAARNLPLVAAYLRSTAGVPVV